MDKKYVLEVIEGVKNPYPRDIFLWDNKEDVKINRGRFNQFISQVFESCKGDIIQRIEEQDD